MKTLLTIAMIAAALLPTSVRASVINGDFQTGDFSGWTPSPTPSSIGASVVETTLAPDYVASINDGPFSLSQTIATVPGQQYLVSFYLDGGEPCPDFPLGNTCGGGPNGIHVTTPLLPDYNDVTVTFGDGTAFVSNLSDFETPGGEFQFTGVASGSSTVLTFLFDWNVSSDSSGVGPLSFDNVAVSAYDDAQIFLDEENANDFFIVDTPEPLTLSVFGAGLIGAALLRRGRKSKA